VAERLHSVDSSAVGNWVFSHAAISVGQAGAAFIGALIALAVVAMVAFVISAVTLTMILRRKSWPRGHAKWAWALSVPVAFVLSVAIPGFYVWLSLAVPVAYWVLVGRIPEDQGTRDAQSVI
jgi:hypothetical protein